MWLVYRLGLIACQKSWYELHVGHFVDSFVRLRRAFRPCLAEEWLHFILISPHYSTLHPASQLLKVSRLSDYWFRHDVDVRLHFRVHRKFWLSVFPRPTIIRLTSITHLCDVVEDRNVSVLLSRQVPVSCKTGAITQVYWPYVWQVFDGDLDRSSQSRHGCYDLNMSVILPSLSDRYFLLRFPLSVM